MSCYRLIRFSALIPLASNTNNINVFFFSCTRKILIAARFKTVMFTHKSTFLPFVSSLREGD
ncbi:Uncharacterised protein [Segatella copri]|nr:Uncharacterised protein [Segatella copri]